MRFNKLDLNLLVALDALFSMRSVSRAAEHLHMSQSALSSALGRLREYFDDELLVQVGRQMELTPRAEMLREPVRDVLVRVDTTITATPYFDATLSDREFRIFVSDFSMAVLMPHMLALAQQQGASVRFQLLPQQRHPQHALEQGDADLLVIPQEFCSPAHPTERLFDEGFCCVVWDQSSHARNGLSRDQYIAAGHVVMQPPSTGQSLEALSMKRTGIERRVEVTTYSFLAAPFLVVGTDRVATVHRRMARRLGAALPIALLPMPVPIDGMEQAMQWHKYRSLDPGMMWLRGLLHEAVLRMDAGLG
ncbi:LysR family transcriptional regulator [Pseudoduganella namucuonensis]|uniref:Transcriptional regulator, LysR family n=1 Tax=Pseudoduganella namucuonensis TaxID=1035707 RepID=A0A1I7LHX1_9BURK|nr:LysR family transcriptional regulator [Pseudoduganella namucuonensis]SFV09260.1 transcriptional regulator, LysR family [Pseudoduganella namucuonensis]